MGSGEPSCAFSLSSLSRRACSASLFFSATAPYIWTSKSFTYSISRRNLCAFLMYFSLTWSSWAYSIVDFKVVISALSCPMSSSSAASFTFLPSIMSLYLFRSSMVWPTRSLQPSLASSVSLKAEALSLARISFAYSLS